MMYGYGEGMAGVLDYDWSKWPEGTKEFKLTALRIPPTLDDSLKEIGAKFADKIIQSNNRRQKVKTFLETYTVDGEMVNGTAERFAVYYALRHRKDRGAFRRKTSLERVLDAGAPKDGGYVVPEAPETEPSKGSGMGMLAAVGAAVALFALSRN